MSEQSFENAFSEIMEIPEGYSLSVFKKDEESLRKQFESSDYFRETYGSYENWVSSLEKLGEIEDPSGQILLRGKIEWPNMEIELYYEVVPM